MLMESPLLVVGGGDQVKMPRTRDLSEPNEPLSDESDILKDFQIKNTKVLKNSLHESLLACLAAANF